MQESISKSMNYRSQPCCICNPSIAIFSCLIIQKQLESISSDTFSALSNDYGICFTSFPSPLPRFSTRSVSMIHCTFMESARADYTCSVFLLLLNKRTDQTHQCRTAFERANERSNRIEIRPGEKGRESHLYKTRKITQIYRAISSA